MGVIAIAAMMTSVLTLALGAHEALMREMPQEALIARAEALKIARFHEAAKIYMQANPLATGTISWPTIASTPGMPLGILGAGFDSSWRIVADGSGGFTLCAGVRDEAAYYLRDVLKMRGDITLYRSTSGKLVATSSQATAETEASKC